MPPRVSWQAALAEAAMAERRRRGEVRPWWVRLDEPAEVLWATTREAGEGWTLCAVARTLYCNDMRWRADETTDPTILRITPARPVEWLAVDEGDMPLVMAALRRYGHHGAYRKSGTDREYRF